MTPTRALSGTAFATLLLIALMMGANHVAARIAFNNGVDVATAVVVRSFCHGAGGVWPVACPARSTYCYSAS